MPESNAFPHHRTGIGRQSPSVIAGNFWDGSTVLLLVGIQHKVAPGRSEYVLSGMSISVVKNGGVLYTAATITYVNEISGYGSFYPGEAAAARYDIIAELGTLRYFERFEARAFVESLLAYRSHIIQSERLQ